DEVRGHGRTVTESYDGPVRALLHPRDGHVCPEVDAMGRVQVGEHLCHLAAENALQGSLERLDHGHVAAGRTRGRRDLEAEPPAADDGDAIAGPDRRLDPVTVTDRPQVPDGVAARDRR